MDHYLDAYRAATGKTGPLIATKLMPLFDRMEAGEWITPKGQQAVDLGFTAHTFNDSHEEPRLYDYYQWVTTHCFPNPINELSAKLIGMAFTSANVIQSTLPQPITLNPWQIEQQADIKLMTKQAIVVENNGIFIWLAHRHPTWPLINQSGNDFNSAYVQMIQRLERAGVRLTYLGDLDSTGIRIAAQLFEVLCRTTVQNFMAIQTPERVIQWLSLYGKPASARTRSIEVAPRLFQDEVDSIHTLGRFVEQEQLISDYEQLIPQWLKE